MRDLQEEHYSTGLVSNRNRLSLHDAGHTKGRFPESEVD